MKKNVSIRRNLCIISITVAGIAALVADRLCPGAREYMLPAHISREPADLRIVQELRQAPDHAEALTFPEGLYLKGLLCYVE